MMPTHVPAPLVAVELQEKVLLGGDLSKLSPAERLSYYSGVCESLGLNPLTRPFEYITLNGKLTLYARKDCTEQLRTKREISVRIMSREVVEGVYVVTAQASEAIGGNAFTRLDESIGAVPIANLQGEAKANAMMKAETKAKRRVTLSICGLGMLDETEIDSVPTAKVYVDNKNTAQAKINELRIENRPIPEAQASAVGEDARQDGGGGGESHVTTQQGPDAAAPSSGGEPPEVSAIKDRLTHAKSQAELNAIYKETPDHLKQDIYATYSDHMKHMRKVK